MNHGWKCRKEKLEFYGFPFIFYHYKLDVGTNSSNNKSSQQVVTDLMNSASDFCPRGPRPAIMFGVREVLVLGPAGDDTLSNDTRAKMVLGAVNVALHNTNCQLPCLVQVMEPS